MLLAAATFVSTPTTFAQTPVEMATSVSTSPTDRQSDVDRYLASQRASRGGAPRWGDSGHPRWDRVPAWTRVFGLCVRRHESLTAGHYRAENPVSSASGAYQFLDSTWRGIAYWTKWRGEYIARKYSRASSAPAWVQDLVFLHSVMRGGQRHWLGTGCGYGT